MRGRLLKMGRPEHILACFAACVVLHGAASLAQPTAPTPDAHTALLLHLDGDTRDAGSFQHDVHTVGKVEWVEGRFGKALKVTQGGLFGQPTEPLNVGGKSWTIEMWIKPDGERPKNVDFVFGGRGTPRGYSFGIRHRSHLAATFQYGEDGGTALSENVGDALSDGKWHHVAAVLDRARHGEVRLYLDGKQLKLRETAFCPSIVSEKAVMPFRAAIMTPIRHDHIGYCGLIDEIHISSEVRPEYATRDPMPGPPTAPKRKPKPFTYDPAASKTPLRIDPARTLIVVHDGVPEKHTSDAAALLRKWILRTLRRPRGLLIRNETQAGDVTGKTIVALGRTRWVDDADVKGLWRDGFIIKRKANVIVICGGMSRGTLLGAVHFLDKFCGVRFYMPGDTFTSLPDEREIVLPAIDIREEPYVKSCFTTGVGGDWTIRNGIQRRTGGSHAHNMFDVFPPSRYAERYPEIYPIIKGKRYIPADRKDQAWQPCFSEPKLLDAAEETALRYFRLWPKHAYLAFSIQDGHAVCECPRCLAAYAPFKKADPRFGVTKGHSLIYWKFMNALAARLETKLPGRKWVALAYGPTRFPPPFKLHPDIIVFCNFHVAELQADRILTPGKDGVSPLDRWLDLANGFGNHDWYQGHGFLIPRIYTGYWSQFMQHLKKRVPTSYQHAEAYANYGLDGPKLYILGRQWWDPDVDVDALWRRLCADLFGPAADPMVEYFTTLEKLWVALDNVKGPERKLNNYARQFILDEDDRKQFARCRALLDDAKAKAKTLQQKTRINLFSKSFRFTEYLIEFSGAKTIDAKTLAKANEYVWEVIAKDPMTISGSYLDTDPHAYLAGAIKAFTRGKRKTGGKDLKRDRVLETLEETKKKEPKDDLDDPF